MVFAYGEGYPFFPRRGVESFRFSRGSIWANYKLRRAYAQEAAQTFFSGAYEIYDGEGNGLLDIHTDYPVRSMNTIDRIVLAEYPHAEGWTYLRQ